MARGVNKVILIGNLGGEPEVRHTPSGHAVAKVMLATSTAWRDKQSGENQERTEWHRVIFYNRLAEIVNEYLRKGSKVYVEGSLRTRKWQDKNGADHYTTEIIVSDMQMLDGRPSGTTGTTGTAGTTGNYASGANNQNTPTTPQPQESMAHADFDDDIPF